MPAPWRHVPSSNTEVPPKPAHRQGACGLLLVFDVNEPGWPTAAEEEPMKLKWWIVGGVLFLSFVLTGRAVAQMPPPTASGDRPAPTPLWESATEDAKASRSL